ncbi:hypothetical protein EV141_1919 [Microcella putealis]|uniref:Uncharacterized protein n=1 Tax=Microcella putealis TaxID=337005 RepID=A0A4Q7LP31_9MICO|nr:hypothetical protein [Microcella putealis]RZS56455.1 hypothetical protein EV141_1919 [Microcella putealis]TQM27059.1 hypothetical protein BJ957_0482 [Microcella putealis]
MSNDTPTTGSHDRTEPNEPTTPSAQPAESETTAAAPSESRVDAASPTTEQPAHPVTPEAPAATTEPEPLREPEPHAAEPALPANDTTATRVDDAPQAASEAHTPTGDTTTTAAAAPAPTVVYVDPPARPKKRGTRGVGLAVVLLATGVFTILYALATILLALALRPHGLNGFVEYLASAPFVVPVLVFAGAHLLLVLIANRAGWWMHVLGGFLVAVLVWVAFIGAAVITAGAAGASAAEQQAVILQQVVNPLGILAAVLAREIPIWVGGIVARRGRTQTAKNAEAQDAYERDLAAHRASVAPQAPTR